MVDPGSNRILPIYRNMGVASMAGASRWRSPHECLNELLFQLFKEKLVVRMVLYPFLLFSFWYKTTSHPFFFNYPIVKIRPFTSEEVINIA